MVCHVKESLSLDFSAWEQFLVDSHISSVENVCGGGVQITQLERRDISVLVHKTRVADSREISSAILL